MSSTTSTGNDSTYVSTYGDTYSTTYTATEDPGAIPFGFTTEELSLRLVRRVSPFGWYPRRPPARVEKWDYG